MLEFPKVNTLERKIATMRGFICTLITISTSGKTENTTQSLYPEITGKKRDKNP